MFEYARMCSCDMLTKIFYVWNCFHEVSASRTRAQETANVSYLSLKNNNVDADDESVRRDSLIQRPRCIKLAGQIDYTV